ncbi:MAG: radical SAM protein [Candidatus Omnitrophota bacterium]|nr:radical SAM protein [Candidatus Omnitrophota bacterium]
MAQIVLFRPKSDRAVISGSYPLGLIYIATPCVKHGYTVKIIDGEAYPDWRAEVDKCVDDSTICAGVNVMTGGSIRTALEFSQSVKKIKQIPVVWGGVHPSFQPSQTLKHPLVDIVVTGEGDKKFLEIVERIKGNRGMDDVKGIFFKKDGKEVFSGEGDFLDLNRLYTPLFDLIDVDYYASHKRPYFRSGQRGIDLNVDRGCPYRCAFCYNIRFNKRSWRAMSSGKVLEIIEELKRKHGINAVTFVSDNFFVDKRRVYEICKGIIDRKMDIEWHTDIRADTFAQYEDDFIKLIKKSGCVSLTFGIESGSDRILKVIDKDIKREMVIKAHEKAKSLGLRVNYHFMIGFPEETKKDIMETMSLMRLLAKDDNASINGPNIYVPYPGTPLYDRCVEMGFVPPDSLEGWENYIWYKNSTLPWFDKSFKGYIEEVRWITSFSINTIHSKNPIKRALYNMRRRYCRLRYIGLMHGIRMFNIDIKLIRFLTGLKRYFGRCRRHRHLANPVAE